jgi:uncharacterized protein (TIGR02271 family)
MQTVVALFETEAEAQRAVERLTSIGVPRGRISLDREDSDSAQRVTADSSARSPTSSGEDVGFFAWLFGYDDERRDDSVERSYYGEAVNRGHRVVAVDVEDDSQFAAIAEVLEENGAIDIDERAQQWRSEGWTGPTVASGTVGRGDTGSAGRVGASRREDEVMPVIQEDLKVGKRLAQTGRLRVYRRVHEQPVEETVRLREEHARVERQAVDRPATEADFAKMRDGVTEVREQSEEAVVSKQARVVEEVRIGKEVSERDETVRDTVRRSEVQVEKDTDHAVARDDASDAALRGQREARPGERPLDPADPQRSPRSKKDR